MTDWIYQGTTLAQAPDEYLGFVYLITNTQFNKRYIGKKLFWTTKKLPPLKGRKNRRHTKVETDWRDYWSSSPALLKDVAALGTEHFRREILTLCKNKNKMSYEEARLQFSQAVLLSDEWYNGIINCRISSRGLV